MKRVIKQQIIKTCKECSKGICTHILIGDGKGPFHRCSHMKKYIADPDDIPGWCPLEDAGTPVFTDAEEETVDVYLVEKSTNNVYRPEDYAITGTGEILLDILTPSGKQTRWRHTDEYLTDPRCCFEAVTIKDDADEEELDEEEHSPIESVVITGEISSIQVKSKE